MRIQDLLEGRKKVEFGNFEHIQVIDAFMEAQKEASENRRMYEVKIVFTGSQKIEIEAESEEEARRLVEVLADPFSAELEIEDVYINLKAVKEEDI